MKVSKASVFISHSTKDTEPAPEPGADDTTQARWRRLQAARALREAIVQELEKLAGIEVWLDKRELQPGMLWRDALHEQLARCDGAVLLLTPEALESGWVLKEATILTWLHALGFKVRLVPVFLGIRTADLKSHGFGPLSLEEIEANRVDLDEFDVDDHRKVADLAGTIAARFTDVASGVRDTQLDRWARALISHWGNIEGPDLRRMMNALKMGEAGLGDTVFGSLFADPKLAVASELLLSEWRKALCALEEVSGLAVNWASLRPLVRPLWVPAAAAKVLPLVAQQPPGQRVILVNGSEPRIGQQVIQRAYCGCVSSNRILAPDDSGDDPGTIVDRLKKEMEDLGVTERGDITDSRPFFLVLGGWAATPQVVEALRTAAGFAAVTYVVMAAQHRAELLRLEPPPLALVPDLSAGCESDARTFENNLNLLGT